MTDRERRAELRQKKKRAWEHNLSKEIYIGVGVGGDAFGVFRYLKVAVVAHNYGVTLSFLRTDKSDHICIYLEPEDARAIGRALLRKGDIAYGVQVRDRMRNLG